MQNFANTIEALPEEFLSLILAHLDAKINVLEKLHELAQAQHQIVEEENYSDPFFPEIIGRWGRYQSRIETLDQDLRGLKATFETHKQIFESLPSYPSWQNRFVSYQEKTRLMFGQLNNIVATDLKKAVLVTESTRTLILADNQQQGLTRSYRSHREQEELGDWVC